MSVADDAPTTAKRADATHTVDARRAFVAEVDRRFRRIRGLVRRTVGYENDAANLSDGPQEGDPDRQRDRDTGAPEAAAATVFATLTTGALVAAFGTWFTNVAESILLAPMPRSQVLDGRHWTAPFVRTGFTRGVNQSTGLLYQAGVNADPVPDGEIPDHPDFRRSLQRRYWSPFSEFEDVTDDMADEMDRLMRQAADEGWNPRKTADEMTAALRSIERDRALTIARTETLFSHADASLANYRRAGVGTVGHVGRIVTPDDALCDFCAALADETFTLREFTGTRVQWRGSRYFVGCPAHPNGRCAPIPKPGVDAESLPPIEDRLPPGATVVAQGFDMYGARRGGAAWS